MAEGSKEDMSGIVPQSDSSDSSIQPSEQSDLVAINKTLTERIEQAQTTEEIKELLKLKEILQAQDLRQTELDAAKFRLEDAKNEISFSRKLTIAREISTKVASAAAVAVGLYLINDSFVFGALILTLGLAKPLEYSLNEIKEFIGQFPDKFPKNRGKAEDSDGRDRGRNGGRDEN